MGTLDEMFEWAEQDARDRADKYDAEVAARTPEQVAAIEAKKKAEFDRGVRDGLWTEYGTLIESDADDEEEDDEEGDVE